MDLQNKKILSLKEGAEYLGYSKHTVYKLIAAGILPCHKPNKGRIYFERASLEAWMLSDHKEKKQEANG